MVSNKINILPRNLPSTFRSVFDALNMKCIVIIVSVSLLTSHSNSISIMKLHGG